MLQLLSGRFRIWKKNVPSRFVYTFTSIFIGIMVWGPLAIAANDTESVMEKPPTGFFTKLALAHGYQAVQDVFQTDRYKPEKPSTTFKSDVDAIYLVFDLLPRENPVHIIAQLYLDKGNGRPSEKLLYDREVYLTTSQDSGFVEFSPPDEGWIPGDYKLKIHLGEEVTEASQIGTMRFKIEPAK